MARPTRRLRQRRGRAGDSATPPARAPGTARGLARLLAATVTGVEGAPPVLSADTVEIIGQQQVRGYDEVLGQPGRAHSIVFQKPTAAMRLRRPPRVRARRCRRRFRERRPRHRAGLRLDDRARPWPGGGDRARSRSRADLGMLLSPERLDTHERSPVTTLYNPAPERLPPRPVSVVRVGDEWFLATSTFEYLPGIPIHRSTRLRELGAHRPRRHPPETARHRGRPDGGRRLGADDPPPRRRLPPRRSRSRWGAGCCTSPRRMPQARGAKATSSSSADGSGSVDGIDPDIAWDADGNVYITYSGPHPQRRPDRRRTSASCR